MRLTLVGSICAWCRGRSGSVPSVFTASILTSSNAICYVLFMFASRFCRLWSWLSVVKAHYWTSLLQQFNLFSATNFPICDPSNGRHFFTKAQARERTLHTWRSSLTMQTTVYRYGQDFGTPYCYVHSGCRSPGGTFLIWMTKNCWMCLLVLLHALY